MKTTCTDCKCSFDVTLVPTPKDQRGRKHDTVYWYDTLSLNSPKLRRLSRLDPKCGDCDFSNAIKPVQPKKHKCTKCGASTINRYFCKSCLTIVSDTRGDNATASVGLNVG
jgi:hypothetical protein